MKCYCCGKPILPEESNCGWHTRCIRKFFGTDTLPALDLSEEALASYVTESVFKGLTVPGVQRKMSLHLEQKDAPRLTLVNYPTGYILKPQTPEYRNLPEAEDLAMRMAEKAGVKTVPHALLRMNGQFAYITKGNRPLEVCMFMQRDIAFLSNYGKIFRCEYAAYRLNSGGHIGMQRSENEDGGRFHETKTACPISGPMPYAPAHPGGDTRRCFG